MSAVYRSRFHEFSLAQATLSSYITTNRHILLGEKAEGARQTVWKLLKDAEKPLRGLVNRNLPKTFIEAHSVVRKEWRVFSGHIRTSLDAGEFKEFITTNDPDLHDQAMEVCRTAHRALNKLATTKSSFPGENSSNQEFMSAMNTVYGAAFDPSLMEAIKAPIRNLGDQLTETASVGQKGPLSKCCACKQDLYDALLLQSEKEELAELSKTFCKLNPSVVSDLERALSKVPEGELKEFSEAVFCRSRLIMICLIESAKSKTDTFNEMLEGNTKEAFVKLSEALESVEAPISLFLEDELDEDCVMLLFQIFQNVTFLTPEYKFDNPNVEDSIKETNIFSAYIQVALKEKYFPKQERVNGVVKAIKDELGQRRKKDYKQVYSAILELFIEGEYEKGLQVLIQLSKKTRDAKYLFHVMQVFEKSGNYHLIKGLLLGVERIPYKEDFVEELFRAALLVKDFDFAVHVIILTKKSPKAHEALINRMVDFINICTDANDWIVLSMKLAKKLQFELAVDILKQIVVTAEPPVAQQLLLEQICIILGHTQAKDHLFELFNIVKSSTLEHHKRLKVLLCAQYAHLTGLESLIPAY